MSAAVDARRYGGAGGSGQPAMKVLHPSRICMAGMGLVLALSLPISSRAQEAGRVGLESRMAVPLVWSGAPSSMVPGQYAPFPSQPVASGLQQDDESGSVPVQLLSVGGGVVGSWLVGVPVLYALDRTAGDRRVKGDAGYSPTAHWGMLLSSSVGAATGVHLVRKGLGATTSMEGALVGASLGTLPMVLGVDSPYLPYFSFTVGSLLQAIGGLLGSH